MTTKQEYTPITIESDTAVIEIDYTNESNFKAGMKELRAQIQWISQCKNEIEGQHERLTDAYDDCVKRYTDADAYGHEFTKLRIPRHLVRL